MIRLRLLSSRQFLLCPEGVTMDVAGDCWDVLDANQMLLATILPGGMVVEYAKKNEAGGFDFPAQTFALDDRPDGPAFHHIVRPAREGSDPE